MRLARQADAEVYHSCEPSFTSYIAMRAMPDRRHMVTFRDPRNAKDWFMELARPSLNYLQVLHNCLFENNFLVRRCIRRMDAVYTIANYLGPKVQAIYGLAEPAVFMPTPMPIPAHVEKASRPTVCYIARLDRRKRPQLFLDLAEKFPPDGFSSNFGYQAAQDDFEAGLRWLLENDRWRERGEAAGAHTAAIFELNRAMDLHEAAYRKLTTHRAQPTRTWTRRRKDRSCSRPS